MPAEFDWDVIVIGAGVSGCMAAVASARNGAKTLLVDRDGNLGGTMTNSLVGPMMTFHSFTEQVIRGLAQEVVDHLIELKASPGHIIDSTGYVATVTPFDHEALKLVLQRMVLESGAKVLLHTLVEDVAVNDGTITSLSVINKNGKANLRARLFIDCSGDADVASRAGAPCELGRPQDGLVQPATLMFKLTDVDLPALKAYLADHPEVARLGEAGADIYRRQDLIAVCAFDDLLQKWINEHQLNLHREHVLLFSTNHPDDVIVNMTRVQNLHPLDGWDLTRAELEAREQAFSIFEFLKAHIPGFAHARFINSGSRIGIRESRRIVGKYVLTENDVLTSRRFEDAIARSAYPIDIHAPDTQDGHRNIFLAKDAYYEIPFRCLLPQKVNNLLVAGRSISATYQASASTRVSPTCMAFGQAAGTAAALCLQEGVLPGQLDAKKLRNKLVEQQAYL